jgi:hypothetical protein
MLTNLGLLESERSLSGKLLKSESRPIWVSDLRTFDAEVGVRAVQ